MLIVPGVWRGFDYAAMAQDIHTQTGVSVLDTTEGLPSMATPGSIVPRPAAY